MTTQSTLHEVIINYDIDSSDKLLYDAVTKIIHMHCEKITESTYKMKGSFTEESILKMVQQWREIFKKLHESIRDTSKIVFIMAIENDNKILTVAKGVEK